MGESRTWLPTLPAEVLSLGAIESVFTFVMSKKFTREDKHRDEIIQMEEGSRTRSHRWDESALQGVDVEHKVPAMHLDWIHVRKDKMLISGMCRVLREKLVGRASVALPRPRAITGPVLDRHQRGIIHQRGLIRVMIHRSDQWSGASEQRECKIVGTHPGPSCNDRVYTCTYKLDFETDSRDSNLWAFPGE